MRRPDLVPLAVAATSCVLFGYHAVPQESDGLPTDTQVEATHAAFNKALAPTAKNIGQQALKYYEKVGPHGYYGPSRMDHEGSTYHIYLRTAGFNDPLAQIAGSAGEEVYVTNVTMGEKNGEPNPQDVIQIDVSGGSRSGTAGSRIDHGEGDLRMINGSGSWDGGGNFRQPGNPFAEHISPEPFDTSVENIQEISKLAQLTQYLVNRAMRLPLDLSE